MVKKWLTPILAALLLITLVRCNINPLRPTEQEQIENVVKNYLIRDTNIPDYEVSIEAVDDNWARVSVMPAEVETEPKPEVFYLQKQKQVEGDPAPTAPLKEQPGHEAVVATTSGWTIILGPQTSFTQAELDGVGVPQAVRP